MSATITHPHAAAVTAMYDAFGRGDVAGILQHLSEDVRWDVTDEPWTPHAAGVPWLAPRRGHAEVAAFFGIIGAWSWERFEVVDLLVSDTRVAAVVRILAVLPTGARIEDLAIHLWTFGPDGSAIALRHMADTAAHIAAAEA